MSIVTFTRFYYRHFDFIKHDYNKRNSQKIGMKKLFFHTYHVMKLLTKTIISYTYFVIINIIY